MTALFVSILFVLVVLYLAIGLGIYFLGTRQSQRKAQSLVRFTNQRLVFKDETIKVCLQASKIEMPVQEEKKDPWNILLVMDKSGSMSWRSAIFHAREAAKNLIASTPSTFSYAIVEFDSAARISCRFTNEVPRLNQTIDKLCAGGDTAIHEGLRLGRQLFNEEADPHKKNALILLSDGGSDPAPAIQQAEELRKAGVLIYTIGMGECNQELLKQIAGDEHMFFYVDDPTKLKDFFHTVGRRIQNALARDVEIAEYPNTAAAPFHIARWGNLRPLDAKGIYHKDKPLVKWFLTGLEEEHFVIDYYLTPRCYGWFPVAHDKAQITMKNHEEQTFSFFSNLGPHVLVIPRFWGWQYLWIFLNPLFWMLLKRVFGFTCPDAERHIFFKKYEKQAPRPSASVQILPPIENPFTLELNPTLAIGIGYGGISALTHLKRFLWEHHQDDKIAEKIALVAIDSVKPYFSETQQSGTVKLEPHERQNLHTDTSQYLRVETQKDVSHREYSWLDAPGLNVEGIDYDIGSGSHQNPAIGRLIYLRNRNRIQELKPLLKKLYDAAPLEPLNICLVCTLGGGTSVGMMMDLCYSIKQLIKELHIPQKSINLFLMDAEPDLKETDRDRKKEVYDINKEAFKRQLARLFAARDTAFTPLPGEEKMDQWFDQIFWVEKKEEALNRDHLYPQTGLTLYQWIVTKDFRDFIQQHNQYAYNSLLTHHVEVFAPFLYKRLLEEYFSLRLLLTVMGNHILGLEDNPRDYSEKSAAIKEQQVTAAMDILLNKKEWGNTRPILLLSPELIQNPNGSTLSHFLSRGGMIGMVQQTIPEEVENYLQNEADAFENLIYTWLDYIMTTPDADTDPQLLEKKLPIAYRSLVKLKTAITQIKDLAESILPSESLLDQKQCQTLSQMIGRFLDILEHWLPSFEKWHQILGEGTPDFTGICRILNDKLNAIEKACEATENLKIPYFKFNTPLKDRLYRAYFLDIEMDIFNQFQWRLAPDGDIKLCIANHKEVTEYDIQLDTVAAAQMVAQVLTLPGYFASRRNQWHHATITDFLEINREAGNDTLNLHLRPELKRTGEQSLLFLDSFTADALQADIPTGIVHQKLETRNPFIHGFFKYQLNQEEFKDGGNLNFDSLPPFVFSEEWNAYNALQSYRQVTRQESQAPSFALVALCQDMEKFLGAVKLGVIDQQVKEVQSGAQMVYRFGNLKDIPKSSQNEKDILNLLREVTQSTDSAISQELNRSFQEILSLDVTTLEPTILQTPLPLTEATKTQLFQIVYGAVQYFKHKQ